MRGRPILDREDVMSPSLLCLYGENFQRGCNSIISEEMMFVI